MADLLPARFCAHPLAHWVISFDAATVNREVREQDGRLRDRSRNPSKWGEITQNIEDAAVELIRWRMPFYFGSLFHIGRVFAVAGSAQADIAALNGEAGLRNSVLRMVEAADGRITIENGDRILRQLVEGGARHFAGQLRLTEEWWDTWLVEVEELRSVTYQLAELRERFGPEWAERTMQYGRHEIHSETSVLFRVGRVAANTSRLLARMEAARTRFTPSGTAAGGIAHGALAMFSMLSVGIMLPIFEERMNDFFRHMQRGVQDAKSERLMMQRVAAGQELLRERCSAADPFERFRAGGAPASPELRDLVREHTLPDSTPSPWLYGWQERLETAPDSSTSLEGGGAGADRWLWAIRSADSTIKRSMDESVSLTDTWAGFIQRVFNTKWVYQLAKSIERGREKRKRKWTQGEFEALVLGAVEGLNALGYSLENPDNSRLRTLLDKANRGKLGWNSDDDW